MKAMVDITRVAHGSIELGNSERPTRYAKRYTPRSLGAYLKTRNRIKDAFVVEHLELLSVFATAPESGDDAPFHVAEMGWYGHWIRRQIGLVPDTLFSVLRSYAANSDDRLQPPFIRLWKETATYLKTPRCTPPCIDTLISHLIDEGILELVDRGIDQSSARNLVFAVLGWQTMLYKAEIGTSPPGQLAITDEMDGHRGQRLVLLRQTDSVCKRPMSHVLMGFGMLLPPPSFTESSLVNEDKHSNIPRSVQPATLNAFVLESIGGLTMKWTDDLAYHLELEQTAEILYLYRWPSFCVANIPLRHDEKQIGGVIHVFGSPKEDSYNFASVTAISSMLQETILSYRWLFGQSKPSRKTYRRMKPFDGIPEHGRDILLAELCGRKRCDIEGCEERESYDLARDFPMYRSRLVVLSQYMSQQAPRTWKELWRDKRDSAGWFTFWAVLFMGGLGLLVGIMQVILQIVQIGLQVH